MSEEVKSEPEKFQKWFIVYPSKDKENVEKLIIDALKLRNITCIYDGNGFNSNTSVKEIKEKMSSCQKILVILTKNSKHDKNHAVFKSLQTSNRTKEVVFIRFNLDNEQNAEEQKKKYVLYGDNRMFLWTPDFDWSTIEETSSVYIGQVWSHFTGYTKIVLPHLEDRIKESEWYKNNPGRFPLKELNLIPESASTLDITELDDDIKIEGELLPIECDRGSYAGRKYKVKVYSITKNNEKYYFVGLIPNTLGILRTLEQGTHILQKHVFPRISEIERLQQVKKFANLLEQLLNHPENKGCNNRAKVLTFNDASVVGDLLLETIKDSLNEERDEIKGDRLLETSMDKVEARDVYQGLAWAYVINYLSLILDKHVNTLVELQKYEPDKKVFNKLIIVVPSSVASKPLKLLDGKSSDSLKQDRPIVFQKINNRDYQLILYTLRKADKEYIVAAEHPNPILCLQEMSELKNISGLSNFSKEAQHFYKLVEKLIGCSTVADKAQVLYYNDLAGKQIDEAIFEVVEKTKPFSFQMIKKLFQSNMNYLYPTEYTKGDLLEFKRYGGVYSHWGVYDANNYIFHLTGVQGPQQPNVFRIMGEDYFRCKVAYDNIKDVAKGSTHKRNNTMDKFYIPSNPDSIIERAKSLMAEENIQYSIKTSNCEHFATYCRYGDSWSKQVDNILPKAFTLLAITGMLAIPGVWKYKATILKSKPYNYFKDKCLKVMNK